MVTLFTSVRKSLADFFATPFFPPHAQGRLLGGGLRLNQRLTVTSLKLHRWVRILDPRGLDFELKPITIKKTPGILMYAKLPAGPNSTFGSSAGSWKLCLWKRKTTVHELFGGGNLRRVKGRGPATRAMDTSGDISTLGVPSLL
ncbi:hypothetical protein M413DRAFT_23488 [Hebeloma cylindrosporum]|uniref:Uncharacterized protein n=1 Tax=Hebeloma cylindrosporum TaxID=76867 RepID=A0A0C3CT54_HEBCY|nr:hypothetical protein M413DRAFT_23488 [Hebeloma cylindrosporum h7]